MFEESLESLAYMTSTILASLFLGILPLVTPIVAFIYNGGVLS